MSATRRLLLFTLEGQRYGLPFENVERVVRVVEITPLPNAPGVVLGVVNVQGEVIAAVDPRRRFGLPAREIRLSQQLVIARTARRRVAMLVDRVSGLTEYPEHAEFTAASLVPGTEHVAGVVRLEDGLVLIRDLERFLSLEEERALDEAMPHA